MQNRVLQGTYTVYLIFSLLHKNGRQFRPKMVMITQPNPMLGDNSTFGYSLGMGHYTV